MKTSIAFLTLVAPAILAGADQTLALIIPAEARACGVFQDGRSLQQEYALKSTIRFVPGRIELPARAGTVAGDLFAEVLLGPAHEQAVPKGPGAFTCDVFPSGTKTYYTYSFSQAFTVAGKPLEIGVDYLTFTIDTAGADKTEIVFDEQYMTQGFFSYGTVGTDPAVDSIRYASCSYGFLPLFEVKVATKAGDRATLHIRWQPPMAGSGPANLVWASTEIGGASRAAFDYWRLVYSADHHNWNERFWVFLDPPIGDAHVLELRGPFNAWPQPGAVGIFKLLDAQFTPIGKEEEVPWEKKQIPDASIPQFKRGDPNNDFQVNVADVIRTLSWLFAHEGSIGCLDAADANDDGAVNISDAVRLLLFLFHPDHSRWYLPAPGDYQCGYDPTPDDLPACGYDVSKCFSAVAAD